MAITGLGGEGRDEMTQRSPQYPRDSRGEQTGVNRSTDGHFIGHRGDDGAIEYGFDVGCGEGLVRVR